MVTYTMDECSLDLNSKEHVYDAMGRRIPDKLLRSTTPQELKIALLDEWFKIPQTHIDNLINSMPNKCATVLVVRRNYTPY